MVEPEIQTASIPVDEHENEVMEFGEADSLSTNENKQMDGEMEETNEEDGEDVPSSEITLELNEELQAGYKILSDLMSHAKRAANWPFMESVEVSAPDLYEVYKQRIEKPMWLKLMKKKFEEHQYTTITDFVSDFRLMLENCYRFNGPDHYISKRAQKMETMLEQKLALLPRDFREKTTIDATTEQKTEGGSGGFGLRRRPKTHVLHDSTYLLNQLREAEYQKKREYRIRQIMARRAEREALAQEIMDWEDKVLFEGKKDQMMAMWEIPQIGLFLFLCQSQLNIGEVMHFELERCFMMARESSTMQLIMTSLLSTPFQRLKFDKKNLMPYKVWEQKLRVKLQLWYKVYTDTEGDLEKTCFKLGLDEQFFDVVGTKNPLERKRYHELSFYRKVWIMKSLCDNCLHTQDSLRETIELQPFEDQREYLLGTDNSGQRYIHFPQFCGADVRVYRQAPVKYPKIEIKPDPFDNKRKFPFVYKPPPLKKVKLKKKIRHRASPSKPASENVSPMSSPLRQRPSRLRQAPKSVVPLQLLDDASVTESSSSNESETEDLSAADDQEPDQSSSADVAKAVTDDQSIDSDPNQQPDDQSVDRLSSGSDATLPYCDNSDTNSNVSSRDPSRDSSPYPSCSDLSLRFSSHIDRLSDVSQESSPCPSPADFVPRRSLRHDRYSDTSRDASPLTFDSDFGLRRSSRNRARLKNIPPLKAARDLSTFLFDENSASNSSALGENSLSGMGTSLFKDDSASRRSSKSSELTEDSNDCDIHVNKLFSNSKTSDSTSDFSASFHGVLEKVDKDDLSDNISVENGDKAENTTEGYDKSKCNEDDNVNNNNINGSLKNLQEPALEGEKSSQETAEPNEQCPSSARDIDNKRKDLTVHEVGSCDLNEEVAKETNLDSFDAVSYTGKLNKDMVENSSNKFSDIKNTDVLQNEERLTSKETDERGFSNSGDEDTPDRNDDRNDDVSENLSNETNDDLKENENNEEMNVEVDELGSSKDTEEREATEISAAKNVVGNSEKTEMKSPQTTDENEVDSNTSMKPVYDDDVENKLGMKIKLEPNSESTEDTKIDLKQEIEENQLKDISKTEYKFAGSEEAKADVDSLEAGTEENNKLNIKTELEESVIDSVKPEIKEETKSTKGDVSEVKEQEESEEEEEKVPDSRQFEMVADTVEEVRKLAEQFAEPEPVVIRRGKKEQIQRPPPRKKNIMILHERLQFLLKELEPWESKLQQASKRARLRLRKEMEDYILKPPEEKTEDWKSSDEETESGESDAEDQNEIEDDTKNKQKVTDDKTSASNSRCSTPIKPPEEIDEIDISHRGRLRKRRIIPNNVEDQLAVKKPKPVKSESSQSTPTTNQPVIVQSGKTQLVDYADIIRQLKNTGGNTPILIKTTQGGRTVLTSVLPVSANSNSNSNTTTTQALQTIRIVSPSSVAQQSVQPQALRIAVPSTGYLPATSKALQHPTIQNLLSGTVAGSKLLPKTSAAVTVTENYQATGQPSVILPPTPEKSNAQKIILPNQTTPQKVVPSPVTTPRKIAPHTTASNASGKPKAKYYAANASTLPINVVEQLIATRGAKLSQGAYNQSILLIPMENDGQTRNVVSPAPVTPAKSPLSPSTTPEGGKNMKSENMQTSGSSTSAAKTSPNTLILPKPQTSPVLSLGQGLPGVQIQQGFGGLQAPQAFLQPAIVDGLNVTRLVPMGISPKSPTRYPTNETVKTLLEKRKPPEEKETFVLEKRKVPAVTIISNCVSNVQSNALSEMRMSAAGSFVPQMSPVKCDQNSTRINSDIGLVKGPSAANTMSQPAIMSLDPVKKEALVSAVKAQQCVITSISAAKLNTLLLQTSAAGAKSIPSLIKLPSKAALDSAVKAVVTSVNVTLPTVNIKVPSPTSLPSIGPRRNVTKTIQTMKSPIPVAPKVVTQSSGGQTTLSFADSHTASSSQMLTVPSTVHGSSSSCNVVSVTQSQTVTGSQDQDGKRLITRLTPQLVLTPKGVMQMGFVNQSQLASTTPSVNQVAMNQVAVSSSVQSAGNQTILIQNSAGQYQLIQQTSPVLQQTGQGTSLQQLASQSAAQSQGQGQNLLQTVKPVVALNASGNPIILPTVKSSTQVAPSSSPPSIVLHKSTYYTQKPTTSTVNSVGLIGSPSVTGNIDLKSPSAGFVFQQPTTGVLHPQTPVVSHSGMISPLLGLQQGLVLQGGVQLASPLVNPVGLNLVHPGVQALQNASSLQASGTPNLNLLQKAGSAGVQMLNINPLLLNASLTTTSAGVLRQQLNSQFTVVSGIQPGSNLGTSLARIGVNTIVKPSMPGIQQQIKPQSSTVGVAQTAVVASQNGASLVSPTSQMIHMQGSPLVIPGIGGAASQQINQIGKLAVTPNSAQKQLVFQYPSVCQTVTNVSSQLTQTVASVSNKQNVNDQTTQQKVVPSPASLAKFQAPLKTQVKLVVTCAGQTVSKNDNLINTVSVNQVTVGQKSGSTQQKLLLFSIGGQLVTGHGVPVSLSDGVLKVVPHGKVKINNQTLTPEQIKQTLAKINEAAAMTLNPVSQQQTPAQQSGTSAVVDQGKVIPVKIVKDSKNSAGPSLASIDHSYLNTVNNKVKIVTSLMNGNGSVVSQTQSGGSGQISLVSPNIQTGLQVVNSDSMKIEKGQEVQLVGQSKEQQYGLKPMGYSSGYIVRQRTSNQEESDEKPSFANQNFDIGKLVVDKETKRFVIKAPVKSDLNGGGDASNNLYNHNADVKTKTEGVNEDDENDDHKLVIDDGVSDKEAALNLLTLANQAPAPLVVKLENNETRKTNS
ncbi:uncharacterized protein LOC123537483 [Mercenaria mercenaria]|uniref:uncharacterized protein LOC123537483 n=1 Tax=Mercenaria mercenaria TaxID=6596 RepID=UPI00234F94A1|nr:uncharacterized protein LOC123537483 [Mercenaria mercenaria]